MKSGTKSKWIKNESQHGTALIGPEDETKEENNRKGKSECKLSN